MEKLDEDRTSEVEVDQKKDEVENKEQNKDEVEDKEQNKDEVENKDEEQKELTADELDALKQKTPDSMVSTHRAARELAEGVLAKILDYGVPSEFMSKDGASTVQLNEVINSTKVIGILFSASWCAACVDFTPKMDEFAKRLASKDVTDGKTAAEFIWIHCEQREDEYNKIVEKVPYFKMAYAGVAGFRNDTAESFNIDAIPSLVLIDTESGKVLTNHGVAALEATGYDVEKFPFEGWAPPLAQRIGKMILGKIHLLLFAAFILFRNWSSGSGSAKETITTTTTVLANAMEEL